MDYLAPPTTSAREAYELCISRIRNANLARRAADAADEVEAAASDFILSVQAGQTHLVPTPTSIGPGGLTKREMVAMYDDRMVDEDAPGRPIYQAIYDSTDWCPMCGHRDVASVDHYLPKAHYLALVTAPANLVPACSVCNKRKKDRQATIPDEVFLHPYFEDIRQDPWLVGSVPDETQRSIVFSVRRCPTWSTTLYNRVKFQFDELGLAELFAAQAADERSGIRDELTWLLDSGGPDAVRDALSRRSGSHRTHRYNSWNAVAYDSWASSSWFSSGGFR